MTERDYTVGAIPENILHSVKEFTDESPFEQNVFIMMRYIDNDLFHSIEYAIRYTLTDYGLSAQFAKDRIWVDDLWSNICVYMNGCKYGIVVFEEIDERKFNPNIALELGYMYALGRQCLILKDKRMPTLPTDVVGKLYKPFDSYNIPKTIGYQVERWLNVDLQIPSQKGTGIPYVVCLYGSEYLGKTKLLCDVLGRSLADQNYKIISGGGPGAGLDVSQSAYTFLKQHKPSNADNLISFVCTPRRKEIFTPFGQVIDVPNVESLQKTLNEKGWGFVFIGGDEGTWKEYEALIQTRKDSRNRLPVILPLGCTGGTAKLIWHDLKPKVAELYSNYLSLEDYEVLNDENIDPNIIVAVVMNVLNRQRRTIH